MRIKIISKVSIALTCILLLTESVSAQLFYFSPITQSAAIGDSHTSRLNIEAFNNFLFTISAEKSLANRNLAPMLTLPMPDGKMAKFYVWENLVMEPGLAGRFPEIKTFAGLGIDDPYATVRFEFNPYFGFSAQVLSIKGDVYIEAFERGNETQYISYYAKDDRRTSFLCNVVKDSAWENGNLQLNGGICRGNQIYTYRLAVACTGEYATAVCLPAAPSVAATMASIVTTINRVNGIYEKELSMRFLLISNNNLLVHLNPASDPYTNGNANLMLNENQSTIDNVIGFNNYDVGIAFHTGNNSSSVIYSVCNSPNKAKAVTGLPNPTGDLFDVDKVAHNLAHLFGASDSHNSSDPTCSGGPSVGVEPGSGTTIMASAGSCGSDNLQPQADPYFHSYSFNQITEFINTSVASCRGVITTGNNPPRITSMPPFFNIPINTPFTLRATAVDDDGDPITYCWEQRDRGPSGTWNSGMTNSSPLFKSRIPQMTGERTFPDMSVILAGYPANPLPTQGGLKGETLPLVTRNIGFTLTIRDNRGGVMNDQSNCSSIVLPYEVSTVAAAGPFKVNMPNGGESWSSGSVQTILWDVAGTTSNNINNTSVNILLSIDGGLTYPISLASNVPNDGFEIVTLPNISTTNARIKVEAAQNIFFDISNNNFSIVPSPLGFEFTAPQMQVVICPGPSTVTYSLGVFANGGFNGLVSLSITGVPTGANVSIGTNPIMPGNFTPIVFSNINSVASGIYYITVTGVSGSISRSRVLVLEIQQGSGPSITTQPVSQTDCDGGNVAFNVAATGAIAYQWQVSTDAGFSFNNITTNGNSASLSINNIGAQHFNYRYRCIVIGQCGSAISNVVRIIVLAGPIITTQPQNATVCVGGNASFRVTVSGSSPTYQWQVNNGTGFSNINGAVSNLLTLTNVAASMNNYQYRCLILASGCNTPTITSTASLTVHQPPTVTINASPYLSLLPGLQTTITATSSVAPGAMPFNLRWTLNGAIIGGITDSFYIANITRLGDYRVEITDSRGCSGLSNVLTISDSISSNLFIFPNPASSSVEIAFYNSTGQAVNWQINIFNSIGSRVLIDKVSNSGFYPRMMENISKLSNGLYLIVLSDNSGKILGKGKLMIQR